MAEETSIAGGRLLGTKPVADAVEAMKNEIISLSAALRLTREQIVNESRKANAKAATARTIAGDAWNGTSNWGGWGNQNGGGFKFNQQARDFGLTNGGMSLGTEFREQQAYRDQLRANSSRSRAAGATTGVAGGGWAGKPNGGGGGGGAAGAGGLGATYAAFAQWGGRHMQSMLGSDGVGVFAANNGGYGGNVSRASMSLLGNQSIGMGIEDRQAAQMIAMTNLGPQGFRGGFNGSMRAGGYLNPTMSAESIMQAQVDWNSAPQFNQMRMFGVNTIGAGGKNRSTFAINKDLAGVLGVGGAMGNKQIQASLYNQNSRAITSLRSMGMSEDQINLFREQAAMRSRLLNRGASAEEADRLIKQVGGQGDTADRASDRLSREYGIKETALQSIKRKDAAKDDANLSTLGGFREGVMKASGAIADFTNAVQSFLSRTGLGDAGGFTGAASSVFSGAATGIGMAGGAAAGMKMLGLWGGKKAVSAVRSGGGRATSGATSGWGGRALGKVGGPLAVGAMAKSAWDSRPELLFGDVNNDGTGRLDKGDGLFSGLFGGGGQAVDKMGTKKSASGGQTVKMLRPIPGPITSKFGPRKHPVTGRSSNHTGIDIGAPNGTPIKAAAAGTVRKAGSDSIYGNQTILDHGNGLATMYGHQSSIRVKVGSSVRQGQVIGSVGSTGLSTGNHLHFEVWRGGSPVDPTPYLGGGGMVGTGGNALEGISSDVAGSDTSAGSSPATGNTQIGAGAASAYGSVNEADAIAAALSGGGATFASATAGDNGSSGAPGGSSAKVGSVPSAPTSAKGNVGIVKEMAAKRGWTGAQWDALYALVKQESGFRNTAQNPTSTAYGMFQFLDSTWGSREKTSDPRLQTKYGLSYIESRYGDPSKAWSFHKKNNWYDKGAWNITDDQNARVHKGEMIIPARQADTIRQALLKEASPTRDYSKSGFGKGVELVFGPGSVVVKVEGGVMDERASRKAAKQFVDFIAEDKRIEKMAVGA